MAHTTHTYQTNETTGEKGRFSWGFLIVGILFIAASIVAFMNPVANLESLAYVFATLAIIYGIWMLFTNGGRALRIVAGILNIAVGIFLFFNIFWAVLALPYIFAIWFIADSILRLATAGFARVFGSGYFWFTVVFAVLGVIIGFMLLFNPLSAALTLSMLVGAYLFIAGVESIIYAFSRPKSTI